MGWFNAHKRSITPYIPHLREFGCVAYVHLKGKRKGLEKPGRPPRMAPRAVKGHLVGYEGLRGHIFKNWIPENVVVRARNVRFFDEAQHSDEEEIQYLVTFQEVQEDDEKEKEEVKCLISR